jgi:hypothetical protein
MTKPNFEVINEIPAMPRYFLVEFSNKGSKNGEVFFHPIIGWALEAITYRPYPITVKGLQDNKVVVLCPSGMIDDYEREETFENIASWCLKNKCLGANVREEMLKW